MARRITVGLFVAAALTVLLFGLQSPSFAAQKTVELRVPGCVWGDTATMVRITIQRIEGVKSVEANPVAQKATIVYDDTKTNPQVFIDALKREGLQVVGEPKFLN